MLSRIIFLAVACLVLLTSSLSAVEPEPPYRTKYRVIDVHLHCTPVSEDAVRAELEVLDRVGMSAVVILDAGGPDGNLKDWLHLRRKYPERLIVFWKHDFTGVKKQYVLREHRPRRRAGGADGRAGGQGLERPRHVPT